MPTESTIRIQDTEYTEIKAINDFWPVKLRFFIKIWKKLKNIKT